MLPKKKEKEKKGDQLIEEEQNEKEMKDRK